LFPRARFRQPGVAKENGFFGLSFCVELGDNIELVAALAQDERPVEVLPAAGTISFDLRPMV
jgi:hypothetical protein